MSESVSKIINSPLDNPVIVSKISSFLNLPSLKVVRSLSSAWLRESRPYFISLAKVSLLPSASDDVDKWKNRLADYEDRLGNYCHTNFFVSTAAYSVSTFNYEEQMLGFATRHGGHITNLEMTIKLKSWDNFRFLLSFLTALEKHGVLTKLSLCVGITKGNYASENDLPPGQLPCVSSIRSLRLSVPPGTHWPCSTTFTKELEPKADFTSKIMSMFTSIKSLKLGPDLQTIPLNLDYLAYIGYILSEGKRKKAKEGIEIDEISNQVEDGEVEREKLLGKRQTSITFSLSSNNGSSAFTKLTELDLLVTHSHMLVILGEMDSLPLERITIRFGQQQNVAPNWEDVKACLDGVVDKYKESLSYFMIQQLGCPEWNVWQLTLPPCPKLTNFKVISNCTVPIGDPLSVEEGKGRIPFQDLFRMGSTILEERLQSLTRVEFGVDAYSMELFDRLFPQEGVALFPRIMEILITLPSRSKQIGEHSLCTQRLANLFPNATHIPWKREGEMKCEE